MCETLESVYGRPRLGNPKSPVDDLIYIILSNKTSPVVARRTYENLKNRFPTWEAIVDAPTRSLKAVLRPAGLATIKSSQIRAALKKIEAEFGSCTLAPLKGMSEAEAEAFLVDLPGVSEKVAKCVMMYTLGFKVLSVDSHVLRVSRRLGWTTRRRTDQCHDELAALVPPERRYAFHVDCITHGRALCRPTDPCCSECLIKRDCLYYKTLRQSRSKHTNRVKH